MSSTALASYYTLPMEPLFCKLSMKPCDFLACSLKIIKAIVPLKTVNEATIELY